VYKRNAALTIVGDIRRIRRASCFVSSFAAYRRPLFVKVDGRRITAVGIMFCLGVGPKGEASMFRLVTRGRVTHDYLKGFISAPEDREPAVRKVIEKAGGKVLSFYFTTGESDFLFISEAEEPEAIIAALMAASATGAVSHVSNVRAWTGAEFKSIAE
jgi:uncharacterized protein with GYD domain